jgi:hypothetical protein
MASCLKALSVNLVSRRVPGFVSDSFVSEGFVSVGFVSVGFVSDGFLSDGFQRVSGILPTLRDCWYRERVMKRFPGTTSSVMVRE